MSPNPLNRHQRKLLVALARRLAGDLGLDDQQTAEVLGDLLSDVPSAELLRWEFVGYDFQGRPKVRQVGREHDGYAPDWLMETLPERVSPRRHWVEGVERAGFGPDTSLEDLCEEEPDETEREIAKMKMANRARQKRKGIQ